MEEPWGQLWAICWFSTVLSVSSPNPDTVQGPTVYTCTYVSVLYVFVDVGFSSILYYDQNQRKKEMNKK